MERIDGLPVSVSRGSVALDCALRPRTSVTVAVNVAGAAGLRSAGSLNTICADGHGSATVAREICFVCVSEYTAPPVLVALRTTATVANVPSSSNATEATTLFAGYAFAGVNVMAMFFGGRFGLSVQL